MNKKLLLLGVTLLSFVTSFAQNWDRPTPANYQFASEMKNTLQANLPYWQGDSTIYYLYNVDAEAFLTNNTCPSHDQWSTHAALKPETGNKVMMAQYRLNPIITTKTDTIDQYVTDSVGIVIDTVQIVKVDTVDITIPEWDGVTYKLLDLYNGAWRGVFPNTIYTMFVDRGSQPDYMWNVKSMGDGIYRIYVSDVNPNYNSHLADSIFGNPETYLGFNRLDPDYNADDISPVMPLVPMLSITGFAYNPNPQEGFESMEDADLCINWKFMPEAEYLKYQSQLKAWDYLASGELDNYIYETEEVYGNKIDLSKLKAFIDSTSPLFYEDIEREIAVVEQAIRTYSIDNVLSLATENEPVDATFLLINPDLETGNTNGWTVNYQSGTNATNIGFQNNASYSNGDAKISNFIEAWANSNFNNDPGGKRTLGNGAVYQLVKDLPAGKYSFTCDAISSRQDEHNIGLEKGAYLYARSGEHVFKTAIHTNDGVPEHFDITFVNVGGDIEFGFMTENTTVNWICADNFTLTYYGEVEETDPYKIILDATIANCEKTYPDVDILMANNDIKETYVAQLDEAKAAVSDYESVDSALNAAFNALTTSINDYKRMDNLINEIQIKAEAFENSDFPDLGAILGDYHDELYNDYYLECAADAAMIDTIAATMGKYIVDFITENVKEGDELTALITNPDFNTDFSGWSTTGSRPAFGGKGGNGQNQIGDIPAITESGNAEVYHNTFNMFQIVRNMPKGSFKLTCQAYERNDNGWENQWTEGPEVGINAVLYANEFEQKIHNIMAFAQEECIYRANDSDGWPTDTYSSVHNMWVPNSMDGANFYFSISPETYQVEINFTLSEAGDSIIIGLKNNFNNSWVIFDNFRLFFVGSDMTAPLNDMITKLDAVIESASIIGQDAIDKIESAKIQINAALASNDPDEGIAAVKTGNETLSYAKSSVSAYNSLSDSFDKLTNSYYEYDESELPEDLKAEVMAMLMEAENAINNCDKTVEEVMDIIERMNTTLDNLKFPAGTYVDLLASDFYRWTAPDATGEIESSAGCAYDINVSTGMPYGDGNVYYLNYADLTKADVLVITATDGTPRCLFNRVVDSGTVQVEVPRDADYWTIEENADGSKTYTVDLKRIREEYGFVHLHAIKGANWVNCTVTSMKVGYKIENLPEAIESINSEKGAIAGIYNLNGVKVTSLRKGLNIIVDKKGNTKKLLVK